MSMELLTEKVITYIYEKHNQHQLRELETNFLEKSQVLSHQFSDWLAYDYVGSSKKTYAEEYLKDVEDKLESDVIKYIKDRIDSYLSFYEVMKINNSLLQVKNLFTNELHNLNKEELQEDVNLNDILLTRITKGDIPQIISSTVTVLPYQFKTLLVGQIIEDYDTAKVKKPYLTFPQYFKGNLLVVLAIVNRLLSFKNQDADITLYQSLYAVNNYNRVKDIFGSLMEVVWDEEEGVYHLTEEDTIIAEIILLQQRLEVECSNKEDQKFAKKILANMLGELIIHLKDEELTIDDLI